MESSVHASLHTNCHHHIIYAKLNRKIYYQPPYERVVWCYHRTNTDHIRKPVCCFNWKKVFVNKIFR